MVLILRWWTFPKCSRQCQTLLASFNSKIFAKHCWNYKDFCSTPTYKITCLNRSISMIYQKKYFCHHDKNSNFASKNQLVQKEIKAYLQQNKQKFKDTEEKLKMKSSILLRDIRETKDKMREKVGTIIEKENIYTIPNLLCISRIILSPYLGMLIIQAEFNFALTVLGFAAVTDLLDGWIARTWESQSSKVGSFLDPMADKVLIATLFLTLTYAGLIPVPLTCMIIMRDILLVIASLIIRYRSLPHPKTVSRYFDFSYATVQLAPTFISKVNTGVQLTLVGTTLAAPVFHYVGHPLLECLWYVTASTTIAAGLSYVISKNTYKFLRTKN